MEVALLRKETFSSRVELRYTDITWDKDGGVLKKVLQEGVGQTSPLYGDEVFVDFVGRFDEDGEIFDSSREKGKMFNFNFGRGDVIKAWDLCIATMKKGEICELVCRSDYAYGDRKDIPTVPPYTTLRFEIELHSWRGEDLSTNKDRGIMRRVIQTGVPDKCPNEDAEVTVSLRGSMNRNFFDERQQVTFTLGEGPDHNIPEGLEKALRHFHRNEKSYIFIHLKHLNGCKLHEPFIEDEAHNIAGYEVHLHDFHQSKESWELDSLQRIDSAKTYKEQGNIFSKQNKYDIAVHKYDKMLHFLQYTEAALDESKKLECVQLQLSGRLNLSMCHLKLKNFLLARDQAELAANIDPCNIKAHFRQGQALYQMSEAAKALESFEKCLEIEPHNKAAAAEIELCRTALNKLQRKEKNIYSGMFQKFAESDLRKLAMLNKGDVMAGDLGEWEQDPDAELMGNPQDELKAVDMIYI